MDNFSLAMQSILIGFGSTYIVPRILLHTRSPRRYWYLAAFAFVMSIVSMAVIQGLFEFGEVLLRSVGVGLVPIIGGYIFVYFTHGFRK